MIKKQKFLAYSLIIIIHCTSILCAYQGNETIKIWPELNINYNISKKLKTGFAHQARYSIGSKSFKWFVYDLNLDYKISKHFKISSKYRYKIGENSILQGIYGNFYYQLNYNPIKITYRLRLNKNFKYDKIENDLIHKRDESHLRNRIILKYNTEARLFPYIGSELFYLLNDDKNVNRFDIYRIILGLELKVLNNQKISFEWLFEEVLNIDKNNIENIFKIGYSFDMN